MAGDATGTARVTPHAPANSAHSTYFKIVICVFLVNELPISIRAK